MNTRLFFFACILIIGTAWGQKNPEQKTVNLEEVTVDGDNIDSKLQKKINKLKSPKWLTIIGNKGSFEDNKSSYIAKNSFESRQENSGRLVNQTRGQFVYDNVGVNRNSQYDYDRLESRLIQVALVHPEVTSVDIRITANCDGYQGVQFLYIFKEDLDLLRAVNSIERFAKKIKTSDLTVIRKIQIITQELCL